MADNNLPTAADLQRIVNLIQNYTDYQSSLVLTPEAVQHIIQANEFSDEDYKLARLKTEKQETKTEQPSFVITIKHPGDFNV